MPPLVDDLLEEVLLRLPLHEPASLVRAALVSRRWRRLVTDPGFRRRFREFHCSPPMLGMLCNCIDTTRFVPTAAFCSPEAHLGHWGALDARHGRVLLPGQGNVLVVWDPIADEEWMLPFPPHYTCTLSWTAAVLCAAAGACDHLDCHRGPFVVVLVDCVFEGPDAGETFICTYASKTAAWTELIYTEPPEPIYTEPPGHRVVLSVGSALVGNALYFVESYGTRVLKYNFELHEMSWILLPPSSYHWRCELITTENGELGFATVHDSNLCICLRKQDACQVGDEWKPSKAIKLKTLLPDAADLSKLDVVGSARGVAIIFIRVDDVIYTIDLKTCKVKQVYKGRVNTIVPYISFYTPVSSI